jgi:hypothetical protein
MKIHQVVFVFNSGAELGHCQIYVCQDQVEESLTSYLKGRVYNLAGANELKTIIWITRVSTTQFPILNINT